MQIDMLLVPVGTRMPVLSEPVEWPDPQEAVLRVGHGKGETGVSFGLASWRLLWF